MENKIYINAPELKQVSGGAAQTEYKYSFRCGDYIYEVAGPHAPHKDKVMILYDVDTNDYTLILHCKRIDPRKEIDIEVWKFLRYYEMYGGYLSIMERRPDWH